jgi:hypothetical protein
LGRGVGHLSQDLVVLERRVELALDRALDVVGVPPELSQATADGAGQPRKFLGADHDQGHRQDEEHFAETHAEQDHLGVRGKGRPE